MKVQLKGWLARKYSAEPRFVQGNSFQHILSGLRFHFGDEIIHDIERGSWHFTGTRRDGTVVSLDCEAMLADNLDLKSLVIQPAICAQGFGSFLKIIIGVILIVASFYVPGSTTWLAPMMFSMGLSLALQGVMELWAKPLDPSQDERVRSVFGYLPNITTFGSPIPIVMGEQVRCGSVVIGSDYNARYMF